MIFLVHLQMLGQIIDSGSQQCDLHLCRPGIAFVSLMVFYNLLFEFRSNTHHFTYLTRRTTTRCPAANRLSVPISLLFCFLIVELL